MSEVPRWQQGPRPLIHGDDWDRSTPAERRGLFVADLVIGIVGVAAIYAFCTWLGV